MFSPVVPDGLCQPDILIQICIFSLHSLACYGLHKLPLRSGERLHKSGSYGDEESALPLRSPLLVDFYSTYWSHISIPPSLCLTFSLCLPGQCVANSCSSSQSGCKILFDSMWTFSQWLLVWFKYSTANISNLWLKGTASAWGSARGKEGCFSGSLLKTHKQDLFKYFASAAPALSCVF